MFKLRTRNARSQTKPRPWPDSSWQDEDSTRPRVLIEAADPAVALSYRRVLEEAGREVAVCWGPSPEHPCPMVTGAGCPLADDADAIVFSLPLYEAGAMSVLEAHGAAHREVPLSVEVSPPTEARYGRLLRGRVVLRRPVTRDKLEKAVARALHPSSRRDGA